MTNWSEDVPEFNIKITVRNNRILQAIKNQGHTSIHAFAKESDVSVVGLFALVNLKLPPLNVEGEFTLPAKKLMEALGACPSDLWTEEQLTMSLRNNKVERVLNKEGLKIALQSDARSLIGLDYPEQAAEEADMKKFILKSLDKLKKREATILCLRFGLDGGEERTLREIGETFNLTPNAIRLIEHKALRRLRNPKNHQVLQDIFFDNK